MEAAATTTATQRLDRWADTASQAASRFLVCLTGPEIARPVSLDRGDVVLGRAPGRDVTLTATGVSRQHCAVRRRGTGAVLEDLGSTNGTGLNERTLRGCEAQELKSGDLIRVGEAALKYLEGRDVEVQYHEAIFRLIGVDALSELRNRRFILEQLDREIARAGRHERPLAVVLLDVDHFKRLNDGFGHLAGDRVLRHLGDLLARATRREDCVGRLGGDEFLVLLPETHLGGAQLFANRLCARVAGTPFVHDNTRLPVTISAGVSAWQPSIADSSALLDAADRALYAAKRAGRSRAETSAQQT